jgi:DNA-cytosine methyltransferase
MSKSVTTLRFDPAELARSNKPWVRAALRSAGYPVGDDDVAVGVKLQKGGKVSDLFEAKLLDDDRINRFDPPYNAISPLCRRWGKERDLACEEVKSLPPQQRAVVKTMESRAHWFRRMDRIRRSAERKLFTVFETFSGGGGTTTGHGAAGGKVLWANEFIPEAARTYKRNFPNTVVDTRDIRKLVNETGSIIALLASLGLRPGELDIVGGSPPCSEFSIAGKGPADPTVMKAYSDGKQRDISGLPLDFVRFALIVRPRVIVMENVPELATRGKEILEGISRAIGGEYFAAWRVLNAKGYGVPQARRRLFVIAVRKDVGTAVGITRDHDVERVFPNPTYMHETIRSALDGLEQSPDELRPWFASARASSLETAVQRLPRNPVKHTRPHNVDPGETKNFTLTRCAWDLPSPTLTVTGQQPSGLAGCIHPDQDRKFSIPEMKRLFGLPDDFCLSGSVAQGAERICRMVPPPLTAAIAESIYERVLLPYRRAGQ